MSDRRRWALALVLPVFGGTFLVVRALLLGYVRTLNESQLHLRVFNHATGIRVMAWLVVLAITLSVTWWAAGRLAARSRAAPEHGR